MLQNLFTKILFWLTSKNYLAKSYEVPVYVAYIMLTFVVGYEAYICSWFLLFCYYNDFKAIIVPVNHS